MKIRAFQVGDEDAVIALWLSCGLVKPQNNPLMDIQRKLRVDQERFLIGEVDGKIVASVMGGYEGHRGWINYLAVSPDYQRRGFGRVMMNTIEKLLNDCGCPKINLQIRQTNSEVIAFYESLGYSIDPVVSMGKRLQVD